MDVSRKVARSLIGGIVILATLCVPLQAQKSPVSIKGFGLFGNAELRGSLRLLEMDQGELDQQKIEDGAFLLLSRLKQSGYLDARLSADILLMDGSSLTVEWPSEYEPVLDPDLKATSIAYLVEEGTLYYLRSIVIDGLSVLEQADVEAFFIPNATLYLSKSERSYSPNIFSNQQRQLLATLAANGYAQASVAEENLEIDSESGAVDARILVDQGPLHLVTTIRVQIFENDTQVSEDEGSVEEVYSRFWIEDQNRILRNEAYRSGFPDARVTSRVSEETLTPRGKELTMVFEVHRGSRFRLGEVIHRGADDTHPPLLNRKTELRPGELLNIAEVDEARRRLSRIGIFDRVDLSYEPAGDGIRNVVFDYTNAQRLQWQALLGYGSYEGLRFGLIRRSSNLFGRAHSLSIEAIQSMKATRGRVRYNVPEILGETIDGRMEAIFLDREELFFERRETGISVGLSTHLERLDIDLGLDYAFERKASSDPQFNTELGLDETNIGSLLFRATRSRLDSVLYPTSGYEIFTSFRYADQALGGQTKFIKPELGASYHRNLGRRWVLHLGARGGLIDSPGQDELILSERFLVGGENSLRGYQRGEASTRNEIGQLIGSEAFFLAQLELEYPLLDNLNLVGFVDQARVWGDNRATDVYDDFTSVGIGLRYKTIVGPVRLEYGHNLDPRPEDPDGTLHLSVGFPF